LNRKAAAEFSFLLAVPTMLVATTYDTLKHFNEYQLDQWTTLLVGFITAFIFAILAIKFFLKFITRHTFIPFGIYRIILGIIFLFYLNHLSI